jgi:hypothetical protein
METEPNQRPQHSGHRCHAGCVAPVAPPSSAAGLVVMPHERRIGVNPDNPNFAAAKAK